MRKLKLQMQVSVDGFVAGPGGELDWLEWNWDMGIMDYVNAITEPVDCILLGRKLAEGFVPVWQERISKPESAEDFGKKMVNTRKIIFSETLTEEDLLKNDWKNCEIVKGDLVKNVNTIKREQGEDMIAYGGSSFVSSLIRHGLIDEYHLFINPTAIGNGLAIFRSLDSKLNLRLVTSRPFECGIVLLVYKPD